MRFILELQSRFGGRGDFANRTRLGEQIARLRQEVLGAVRRWDRRELGGGREGVEVEGVLLYPTELSAQGDDGELAEPRRRMTAGPVGLPVAGLRLIRGSARSGFSTRRRRMTRLPTRVCTSRRSPVVSLLGAAVLVRAARGLGVRIFLEVVSC